jgi:hypothetical protein
MIGLPPKIAGLTVIRVKSIFSSTILASSVAGYEVIPHIALILRRLDSLARSVTPGMICETVMRVAEIFSDSRGCGWERSGRQVDAISSGSGRRAKRRAERSVQEAPVTATRVCPRCGAGRMVVIAEFPPWTPLEGIAVDLKPILILDSS